MDFVKSNPLHHPDEEDIQNAYIHASLLENLPASFEFEEIFDEPNSDTFVKYIDCNNDTDGRMNLYRTFLKCAYRKGFYIRRYSWDDRDYEPAIDAIKLEKMKKIAATTQTKSDLNKIVKLLFPHINFYNIY